MPLTREFNCEFLMGAKWGAKVARTREEHRCPAHVLGTADGTGDQVH